ncbi:hypothetical protein GCM10009554_29420 [Kribbella koreensis]|uniref:Uncharacterized protein n=1 Tax=Kribbella koreensis TaxID=57909 RepID=A0ABP4APW2_9ACTN
MIAVLPLNRLVPEPLGRRDRRHPEGEQRVLLHQPDHDDPLGRRLDLRGPELVLDRHRKRAGLRTRRGSGGGVVLVTPDYFTLPCVTETCS